MSAVPEQFRLHSTVLGYAGRGKFGKGGWHGVTNGQMIQDIIMTYHPGHVMDPMAGSFTVKEVCDSVGIPCLAYDIQKGDNVMNADVRARIELDIAMLTEGQGVDFIWWDPPYWNMAQYSDDPDDLCNVPTYEAFLVKIRMLMNWLGSLLSPNGILALEMADLRTASHTYFINDDMCESAWMKKFNLRKEVRFVHAYKPTIRDVDAYVKLLKKLRVNPSDDLVEIEHEYITIIRTTRKEPPVGISGLWRTNRPADRDEAGTQGASE